MSEVTIKHSVCEKIVIALFLTAVTFFFFFFFFLAFFSSQQEETPKLSQERDRREC